MKIFLADSPLNSKPKRRLNREAFSELSGFDQKLFESFGQGDLVHLPYNHIHHAFESYAKEQPEAVAVIHEGQDIKYRELNQAANHLAQRLSQLGVGPGDNVGLFLQRSIPMVVGILGVLKAGAAYVPQDLRLTPEPQLLHILNLTKAKVVLTLATMQHLVPKTPNLILIALDEFISECDSQQEVADPLVQSSADAVCFVLFTSGTTGFPNGVQVTHKNVCNILLTDPGSLGMRPGLKVSQILNIAFDMSAWETLGALSHGATLLIRGKSIQAAVEQVDVVIATPSVLASLDVNRCRNVKTVAVAGEPCPKLLADLWSEFATFYNSCGPTEVTIVNTMQPIKAGGAKLTIGKPTPNNTVYILDENLKPCKIGEIGEMWAGGDCVSLGYIGNPVLTSERYKPDPFFGDGRIMFRTRDLGRWTENGELEHFGRTDDQVKIRGFRVELDSVSGALETLSDCVQAVTLKLDDRNLVSFVRPGSVDLEAARQAVAKLLPYYCAPSLIVPMEDFPVTSRGKIDKRALTVLAAAAQESGGL